jgi:2-oxoglutarate ferredoxin oxidoreductase subunit delta
MKLWRKPLDADKVHVPHGVVSIIIERCKGCSFCVEYCPRDVLRISERFNKKGYHYPEVVAEGLCVDCNLCEDICPEFAIFSEAVEEIPAAARKESA